MRSKVKALFDNIETEENQLDGLFYQPELIDAEYEVALLSEVRRLPFRNFEFHGYLGKRQVVSYGWRYDYTGRGALQEADAIPDFLLELRQLAASFAKLEPANLQQVLVTQYEPGAGIGWHRDKPVFEQVIGVSLLAPCVIRFRHRDSKEETGKRRVWRRVSVPVQNRSIYLLSGPARWEWEHSIAGVAETRYSVTFRSLRTEKR